MKCTSDHLTSLTVLVNLNPFSNNGTDTKHKALEAVSYIGLTISILRLLATIVLAALMQYFFLASFCWMLCEGIMLYLLVVRVFGNAAQRWYWLLIVGWGEYNTSTVAILQSLRNTVMRSAIYTN